MSVGPVLERLRQRAPRHLLHVVHKGSGGVELHVKDLCRRLAAENEASLILRPDGHGGRELATPEGDAVLAYPAAAPLGALVEDLRKLRVWHLHYHQTIGLDEEVWDIPDMLGVRFDYTVHDYHLGCPRIHLLDARGRFCGQPEVAVCERCVAQAPLDPEIAEPFRKAGSAARWRAMHRRRLGQARRIFAPSEDAAERFRRFFDLPSIRILPHPEEPFTLSPRPVAAAGELRVAVIGAIGPHKGHELLVRTARRAQARKAPVRFVFVGFTCDDAAYRGLDNVQILGRYEPGQLPALLDSVRCDAALFLSQCPETYSYTLTAAWRAGLVPIVSGLGALAERVRASGCGVVLASHPTPEDVLDAILGLRCADRRVGAIGECVASYGSLIADYYGLTADAAERARRRPPARDFPDAGGR